MAATRTQQEIRQRAPILLIALLALNFVLMAFDARDETTKQRKIRVWAQTLAYPFQRGTTTVGGAGLNFFQRYAQLRNAQTENELLKQQLAQKDDELRQAQLDRYENARLRELLSIKETVQYPVMLAQVIARDPNQWFQNITIDVGSNDGVELNMPVMAGKGLVGRVIVVGPVSSQVMLITDDKSAAGAAIGQVGESGAIGSVRGTGRRDSLEMRYVSGMVEVNPGENVLTTGQDKIYPPGLLVGAVEQVIRGTATSPHTIYVRPAAQLYSLTNVAVIKYHPPQGAETGAAPTPAKPANTPAPGGAVKVFGSPTPTPH